MPHRLGAASPRSQERVSQEPSGGIPKSGASLAAESELSCHLESRWVGPRSQAEAVQTGEVRGQKEAC